MVVSVMKIDQVIQGMKIQTIKKELIQTIKFQTLEEMETYLEKIKPIKVLVTRK